MKIDKSAALGWVTISVLTLITVIAITLAGCKKEQTAQPQATAPKKADTKTTNKIDTSLNDLKARGVFILGLDDSFPPMGFRDDDNSIIGFDIDLAKEVSKRLGVSFKAQPISWDAKELELSTGKIDCIWNGFTITDERKETLCMSTPYLNNAQVLVVREDSPIKSLSDVKGITIGLQKGSSAQEAVDSKPDFVALLKDQVYYQENITALNDLELGGVDAVVMDSIVAEYDIAKSKKPLRIIDEVLAREAYGIGFRKDDVLLCDEVQKILKAIKDDGTASKISTNWFGRDITVIE